MFLEFPEEIYEKRMRFEKSKNWIREPEAEGIKNQEGQKESLEIYIG